MNLLNLEDDKYKDIIAHGFKFKIRYISPIDRVQITQKRLALQNGNPVETLTENEFLFFENISIVDICTENMPKEFSQTESCIKWPDINLIDEVANEIRKHTIDIESRLKKNRPIEGSDS